MNWWNELLAFLSSNAGLLLYLGLGLSLACLGLALAALAFTRHKVIRLETLLKSNKLTPEEKLRLSKLLSDERLTRFVSEPSHTSAIIQMWVWTKDYEKSKPPSPG